MRRLALKFANILYVESLTCCVCGDKEVEAGKVAVRTRRGKDLGSPDVNEVVDKLLKEIRSRSLHQLEE